MKIFTLYTTTYFRTTNDLINPDSERLKGVKTLFIVPDKALDQLPFAVLVTEPVTGDPRDYQKVAWLARRWAPVTLPTVSSLQALRSVAAVSKASEPFIGFGNPDFVLPQTNHQLKGMARVSSGNNSSATNAAVAKPLTVALTRSAIANADDLRAALVPLPETADELRAIATSLGAKPTSLRLGSQASVPVVKTTQLAKHRVVAFSTHALVTGDFKNAATPKHCAFP